jgi:hypothetical protein
MPFQSSITVRITLGKMPIISGDSSLWPLWYFLYNLVLFATDEAEERMAEDTRGSPVQIHMQAEIMHVYE